VFRWAMSSVNLLLFHARGNGVADGCSARVQAVALNFIVVTFGTVRNARRNALVAQLVAPELHAIGRVRRDEFAIRTNALLKDIRAIGCWSCRDDLDGLASFHCPGMPFTAPGGKDVPSTTVTKASAVAKSVRAVMRKFPACFAIKCNSSPSRDWKASTFETVQETFCWARPFWSAIWKLRDSPMSIVTLSGVIW
jgi:hypothetical protein